MGCTYHFLKKNEKKNCGNCGNAIAENGRKKKIVCGNGIAEIGGINFWQLWQWHCRKWGKKKKKRLRNM